MRVVIALSQELVFPLLFQIVLSGDPHQLGAVLRSPITQTYGLNLSLLERLMARIPYLRDLGKFSNHGCYDPLVVTKLVQNYRSHEAILAISSRLFYHSEMISCAEESLKNCLCEWDALPKKDGGFPLLFHGVKVRMFYCKYTQWAWYPATLQINSSLVDFYCLFFFV